MSVVNEQKIQDAYSNAVMSAVDTVGPAVANLLVEKGPSSRWLRNLRLRGAGTGVFISDDGYMLTNSHVVSRAAAVKAKLLDGTRFRMRVIGTDPATDLALVKADVSGIPFARLGESAAVQVGQLAVAIGNPLGFQSTVSAGVVSSTIRRMRTVGGRILENVIQHTAPLNPGNSGGPLVNASGEVIGINTAIIAMAQGLGFSIPVDVARWVEGELRTHGRVRRAYFGIIGRDKRLSDRRQQQLGIDQPRVVEVVSAVIDGPAYAAGLQRGDLVVAVNDRSIADLAELHRAQTLLPVTKPVSLTFIRHGDRQTVVLEVTEPPA